MIYRIAVFGAGGVGGYFGGILAKAGMDVTFVARGEHLSVLQESGLTVESITGDFHIQPVKAEADPARVGVVDAVILGVKAWQVPDAARAIIPMIGQGTIVLPLQNGVDAPVELMAVLGSQPVIGGVCKISSHISVPGGIRHTDIEPYIALGEIDGQRSQRVERLLQVFLEADVNAEIPEDIQAAMWQKFIFIAAISGVGAVTRMPVGTFREIPESREMLKAAIGEIVSVGMAKGVDLPADIASRTMDFIDSIPGEVMSSMQRDIMGGRPSELGSQIVAVVRLGLETGVQTPVNSFIYASLLPIELAARGE